MDECLLPPRDEHVDAYVVFRQADDHPAAPWWWQFWRRWFAGDVSHCFPLFWDGEKWLAFDAGLFHLTWGHCGSDPDLPQQLVERGARVVHVRRTVEWRFYWRGLTTCVSTAKMALGVRAAHVLTPAQLLIWLLREGHEEVRVYGQCSGKTETFPRRHSRATGARSADRSESVCNGSRRAAPA